jgi:hypothetical protein
MKPVSRRPRFSTGVSTNLPGGQPRGVSWCTSRGNSRARRSFERLNPGTSILAAQGLLIEFERFLAIAVELQKYEFTRMVSSIRWLVLHYADSMNALSARYTRSSRTNLSSIDRSVALFNKSGAGLTRRKAMAIAFFASSERKKRSVRHPAHATASLDSCSHSDSGTSATARHQPALAPSIFTGIQET